MKKKIYIVSFIIAFIVIAFSGASNAVKLIDDDYLKAGIFNKLIENTNIVAISPSKLFKSTSTSDNDMSTLLKDTLENIFNEANLSIVNIKNKNGNTFDNETAIGTGSIVTANDEKDYIVLLYGDANGDGRICNSVDVEVIRQDYVFGNEAEGVYRKAADLFVDDILNVKDVQIMSQKYLGKYDDTIVIPFPEEPDKPPVEPEKDFNLNPSTDFRLAVLEEKIITADAEVEWSWDETNTIAEITEQDDGSVKVVGKNPGEITITAIGENNKEKSLKVTVYIPEIKPEFEVETNVAENDNKVKVTVDVTNKLEIEKYTSIDTYTYELKKVEANGSITDVQNKVLEENETWFINLSNGTYKLKTTVSTKLNQSKVEEKTFVIDAPGPNPEFNVTINKEENSNSVMAIVNVTNIAEIEKYAKVNNYVFQLDKKESDGTTSNIISKASTANQTSFSNLDNGTYILTTKVFTSKGKSNERTNEFIIKVLKPGQTEKTSEAVAKIEETEEMFTSIQYAVDAAENNNNIIVLKNIDTEDHVIINKTLNINLNGKEIRNYFNIKEDAKVEFIDSTDTPGAINLRNNTLVSAIAVDDAATVTLKNGINVYAYKCALECTNKGGTINLLEANIEENLPERVSIDDTNRNNSAITIIDGTLNIGKNNEVGKVNISGDRYGIKAEGSAYININNNQDKTDEGYKYEIYGNLSAINIACEDELEAAQLKIYSGRLITEALSDRTVLYLNGNIDVQTTGGIMGNLETGYGIRASHIEKSDGTCILPKFKLNGSTKIYGTRAIQIGETRFNVPNADFYIEIGTDYAEFDYDADYVSITGQSSAMYVGTTGKTTIIMGKRNTDVNEFFPEFGYRVPVVKTTSGTYAVQIVANSESTLEMNCQAIILNANQYVDALTGLSAEQIITTTTNARVFVNDIVDVLGMTFKGVYVERTH